MCEVFTYLSEPLFLSRPTVSWFWRLAPGWKYWAWKNCLGFFLISRYLQNSYSLEKNVLYCIKHRCPKCCLHISCKVRAKGACARGCSQCCPSTKLGPEELRERVRKWLQFLSLTLISALHIYSWSLVQGLQLVSWKHLLCKVSAVLSFCPIKWASVTQQYDL